MSEESAPWTLACMSKPEWWRVAVPALGAGSETRAPMSIAVLGGLSVSTVLSLLVVPAFYVIADRMKTRVGARLGKKPDAESGPHPPRTDEPRPATHG